MPVDIIDEIRPHSNQRATIREWAGYFLGVVSILLLVALATNAYATDIPVQVLEKDGITIRLMNKPCVEPVSVSMIVPSMLGRFKAIESVWPEKDGTRKAYAGCWAHLTPPEALEEGYLVVFSDGQSGFIPKGEFKKMRGQVGV
jgi:hypothetical protein